MTAPSAGSDPVRPDGSPDDADALLAALLRIGPVAAERVRRATPGRIRPRRQQGPSADYGDG